MCGVDQSLEGIRSAIASLHGIRRDAVVSPVPYTGKCGYGHEFEGGDSEIFQIVETLDDAVEISFGGKCPYMKLINYVVVQIKSAPGMIGPRRFGRHDLSRTVDTLGKQARHGVGHGLAFVHDVGIAVT